MALEIPEPLGDTLLWHIPSNCTLTLRTRRNEHARRGQTVRFYLGSIGRGYDASALWISRPGPAYDLTPLGLTGCVLYSVPGWSIGSATGTWDVKIPEENYLVAQAVAVVDGNIRVSDAVGMMVGR